MAQKNLKISFLKVKVSDQIYLVETLDFLVSVLAVS